MGRAPRVGAYYFTCTDIAHALIEAHRRGVRVEVLLDKRNRKMSDLAVRDLFQAGVPLFIDDAHAIAHGKYMVIDGRIVIHGSFNFTDSAETRNEEVLTIIADDDLAGKFTDHWREHHQHSIPARENAL